ALVWLRGVMQTRHMPVWNSSLRRCLEQELRIHLGGRPLESRRLLTAYLRRTPPAMTIQKREEHSE
ncbi:MAG: DNA repair protein RecO, partial [Gammaproteobacteria bacterium]|nr:DNA repair protein RecO [Gammaproteobacteria bacterium]